MAGPRRDGPAEARPRERGRENPDPGGARPGSPVILVIDDDDYVHSTLAAAMRGLRVEVLRASSAGEGRALALEHRPDLAIIDVGLPDVDGYELTRSLRDQPELDRMRVCILTGHLPDPIRARDAGADVIIGKPFRLEEFLETVRVQLGRSE